MLHLSSIWKKESLWNRHIREVHLHFRGKVHCGVNGCPATPSTYEGLRQHMYRYHRDLLNIPTSQVVSTEDQGQNEMSGLVEDALSDIDISPISSVLKLPSVIGTEFILKTRDGRYLTQVATDGIVQDAKFLVQNAMEAMKEKVVATLKHSSGVGDEVLSNVESIFSDNMIIDPFQGLETHCKQEKFIQQYFNYVVSSMYNISIITKSCQ